jgi:hypothetical protein
MGVEDAGGGHTSARPSPTIQEVLMPHHVARRRTVPLRIVAALLCLGVAAVHIVDQGGIPGTKTPGYVQAMYYALELGGVLTAITLLVPRFTARWGFALGIGISPIVGYVLSRSTGLPNYTDDIGNWFEPLGVAGLVVETVLVVACLGMLGFARRRLDDYRAVVQL